MPSCVYCGAEADNAEHWLLRSLGTFGLLQVLHGALCGACNEAVGEADREFIETGPEGIHGATLTMSVGGVRGVSVLSGAILRLSENMAVDAGYRIGRVDGGARTHDVRAGITWAMDLF